MSIDDSKEKINPVKDREGSQRPSVFNGVKLFIASEKGNNILIVIIIILVALGSFELGRLSKESTSQGIKIEYKGQLEDIKQSANVISAVTELPRLETNSSGKTFFASNRGNKYYSISCSAGKTIKQENRVWFATGEEAEKAGYSLSASCQ